MLIGWKVFRYSRMTQGNYEDEISYCNTQIAKYSRSILHNAPQNMLEIYNTPANTIEAFIDADVLEIRLLAWDRCVTYCIILEKMKIGLLKYELFDDKNVRLFFIGRIFELKFYSLKDMSEFAASIKTSGLTGRSEVDQSQNNSLQIISSKVDIRLKPCLNEDITKCCKNGEKIKNISSNQEHFKSFVSQMNNKNKYDLKRDFIFKTESIGQFVHLMKKLTDQKLK